MRSRSPLVAFLSTIVVSMLCASGALADEATSSNWAGYAIHGTGVSYSRVIGSWTVPNPTCTPGRERFSAAWIGLGGFSAHSKGLEQVGTEADCSASGRVVSFAWMELVPAPSKKVSLQVSPGDQIAAYVAVSGHEATLALEDTTTHQVFKRTMNAPHIDISSAEWIVEAPSECRSVNQCVILPLANFGTTPFALAVATSTAGHNGSISDSDWGSTEIRLVPHSSQQLGLLSSGSRGGGASPSALSPDGTSFDIVYSNVLSAGANPFQATRFIAHRAG